MAQSVVRRDATKMAAIGLRADKVGLWRALDMTRLTHQRHFSVERLIVVL
jgi:hypothetical protein